MVGYDFPALPAQPRPTLAALLAGLKRQPIEKLAADDYVAVYAAEDDIARQRSRHGSELHCELRGERVTIAGYAAKFLEGEMVVSG